MFTVYVLYSEKYDKIYIGYTTDLESRYLSHNLLATKGWTVNFRPWKIILTENYPTKSEAMRREKMLKGGQGRAFIRNNLIKK
ncbi:MAG: GIY-YIG nuclease family protein [Bacteroidales bacterium]|nr:GIY-YIG nuclease family protein [Bacteroidales bacterium]MCF8376946.1 GIY-YIG nuclease family protein [Bacteroidales bacterium]